MIEPSGTAMSQGCEEIILGHGRMPIFIQRSSALRLLDAIRRASQGYLEILSIMEIIRIRAVWF